MAGTRSHACRDWTSTTGVTTCLTANPAAALLATWETQTHPSYPTPTTQHTCSRSPSFLSAAPCSRPASTSCSSACSTTPVSADDSALWADATACTSVCMTQQQQPVHSHTECPHRAGCVCSADFAGMVNMSDTQQHLANRQITARTTALRKAYELSCQHPPALGLPVAAAISHPPARPSHLLACRVQLLPEVCGEG